MIDTNKSVQLHVHWIVKIISIIGGAFSFYYAFVYLVGAYQHSQVTYLFPGLYFLFVTLFFVYTYILSITKIDVDNEKLIGFAPPHGTYMMRWDEVTSFKKFQLSTVLYGDEKAFKFCLILAGKGRKQFKEYINQQITNRQIEEYKPAGITRSTERKMVNNSKVGKKISVEREFVTNIKQVLTEVRIDEVLKKFDFTMKVSDGTVYIRDCNWLKKMITFSPKSRRVEAFIRTSQKDNNQTLVKVTYIIHTAGHLFLSDQEREYWNYEIKSVESSVCSEEVVSSNLDQKAQEVSRHNWINVTILIGVPIITVICLTVLGIGSSASAFSMLIYTILGAIISFIITLSIVKSRLSTPENKNVEVS